jgi:plastocyanin
LDPDTGGTDVRLAADGDALAARARVCTAAIVIAAAGALALAGCGGGKSSGGTSTSETSSSSITSSSTQSTTAAGGAKVQKLSLSANPQGALSYNTKMLTAKAGEVEIAFTNMSPLDHNVTLESSSGKTLGATPTFQGATKTLTLNLQPGTYKFFCSVPGHRQAGMEGTLKVVG